MLSGPVLLYDGDCAFCRTWVARLARCDGAGRIDCVPADQRDRISGLPQLDAADLNRAVHLVTADGTVYRGADAFARVVDYFPRWRLLGPLLRLPGVRWASHRVYSAIAARRHRFGCGSDHCRIGEEH
jgi:predicted DCC family thiol-disulfide oxidoreductase YuxK